MPTGEATMKKCNKCGMEKPLNDFHNDKNYKDGKRGDCKECRKDYIKNYYEDGDGREKRKKWYEKVGREKAGHLSMYENKSCANYLGIVIGERLVRHLFKDVEVMSYGFPDYDFICNKGKKIDVKTGCIQKKEDGYLNSNRWQFHIENNKIADFFLCVAFNYVENLIPLHLWMMPASEVNDQAGINIGD